MTRSVRLRPWQKAALERFAGRRAPDFLAVATPGAGKTTFALAAPPRHELRPRRRRRRARRGRADQRTSSCSGPAPPHRLGLAPRPGVVAADGALPADVHGIVTTYQQVAASASALARRSAAGAFVILDEIHHAGDERAWGDAVRIAFEPARAGGCALSGTPFR